MKPFKSIGIWFLPENPSRQIAGNISFGKRGQLSLALADRLREGHPLSFGESKYPIIHGVIKESPYGKFVTLLNCFSTSFSLAMPGLSVESVHSNHGCIGNFHVDSPDATFTGATFTFPTLTAWFGSRLQTEFLNPYFGLKVTTAPSDLECQIGPAKLRVSSLVSNSSSIAPNKISIEETAYWQIEDSTPSNISEIHSQLYAPALYLMTLVQGSLARVDEFQVHQPHEDGALPRLVYRLFRPVGEPLKKKKRITPYDLLFRLADVADRFGAFMLKWHEFLNKYKSYCSLFYGYQFGKSVFVETRLLFLVLAIHSFIADEGILPPGWPPRIDADSGFPGQIHSLFKSHWGLVEKIVGTGLDEFVESIVATAEYVMGRGEPRSKAIAQGGSLFWLTERTVAVMKIIMLKKLDFSDTKITELIAQNREMQHLERFH